MKSQKGITLISLTIYIIAMLIVISIMATLSVFFYNNVYGLRKQSENAAEYSKFDSEFLEEIKKPGNKVIEPVDNQPANIIIFSSGVQFSFQDGKIYKDQVKICDNVTEVEFKVDKKIGKTIVGVRIIIGGDFTKVTSYTMNY